MVNKIDKALLKLSKKEQIELRKLFLLIKNGDVFDLDIKKLKDRQDIYRIRKGLMRIIFQKIKKVLNY